MQGQFNFDKSRVSKDKSTNNEGHLLIEICKSNNLFILNGRCGKDKGVGVFTFKHLSVIDYSIVSAQALNYVENFAITELDCLYSEGHSLLSTDLKIKKTNIITNNYETESRRNPPKSLEFLASKDENKISEIIRNIHYLQQNGDANKEMKIVQK